MLKPYILSLVVLVSLTACSNARCPFAPTAKVDHVVVFWLKEPGNEAQRQQLIDRANNELRKIPGVISVQAGRAIPSTRPVVDSSFDVAMVMTFKDEAALRAYEKNPAHLKAIAEVLTPLTAKRVIYDIDVDTRKK